MSEYECSIALLNTSRLLHCYVLECVKRFTTFVTGCESPGRAHMVSAARGFGNQKDIWTFVCTVNKHTVLSIE
jgi:hypothetical protein